MWSCRLQSAPAAARSALPVAHPFAYDDDTFDFLEDQ